MRLVLGLIVATALVVAAAGSAGGIADEPCPNIGSENTNTCPSGEVGAAYSLRFAETEGSGCGPGRQTFHHDSGTLPPALTLAPDGTLSGVPTQIGTFRFYVEMREPGDDPAHCAGKRTQKQFTLKICRQLGVVSAPTPSPRAEVGAPFRMTLSSCGSVGALAWTLSAGALPVGVALRGDGSIAGTPRRAGSFRFTATVTDVQRHSASFSGTVAVAAQLRIPIQRLPAARVGHAYRAKIAALDGVGARRWDIERGRLPRGMHFDRTLGVLGGTPTRPGAHTVTFEARDELASTAARPFTILVLPGAKGRGSRVRP